MSQCLTCSGGGINSTDVGIYNCSSCGGSGKVREKITLTVVYGGPKKKTRKKKRSRHA